MAGVPGSSGLGAGMGASLNCQNITTPAIEIGASGEEGSGRILV
jgi:hypothetical protein